jgi:hypothetical protein
LGGEKCSEVGEGDIGGKPHKMRVQLIVEDKQIYSIFCLKE